MTKSFNWWAKEIHQVAADHGFWPEEGRNFGEMIALMHSEISEAWEEFEGHRSPVYHVDGKPEGIAVELVDCAIRILDTMYSMCVDVDDTVRESVGIARDVYSDFPVGVARTNVSLSNALEANRDGDDKKAAMHLGVALRRISVMVSLLHVSFETLMDEKVEYNRSRPYKHGRAY